MLSHRALLSECPLPLVDIWRFPSELDVLIHALPLNHVHGLFVATHVLMLAGGSIILQPRVSRSPRRDRGDVAPPPL